MLTLRTNENPRNAGKISQRRRERRPFLAYSLASARSRAFLPLVRTRNGSALLLVLFTLLLISGLVLSALTFLESGVEDYGALNHQFRARQLARSGLAYGLNPQITNQDTPLLN